MKKLFLFCGLLPLCVGVSAQQKDSLGINLHQVVVTGTGTHHRMTESPVPVQVITAKDIKNSNASTLEDVLQLLTPSFSQFTNGMGTTLTMNGLPENYFVFLVNGLKVSGDETYPRISIGNIKRIEILSGASSALYGTNAIGGVINIITTEGTRMYNSGDEINYFAESRLASKGRTDLKVNISTKQGKWGIYYDLNYRYNEAYQLSGFQEKQNKLVVSDKVANNGLSAINNNLKLTFDINKKMQLYARGQYYDQSTKRPKGAYKYDMAHQSWMAGAGLKYMLGNRDYLTVDYFADNFKSMYDYFNSADETRKKTHNHTVTAKGIFNLGNWNKVSVGTEFLYDILNSEVDQIDRESYYTLSFFGQDEMTVTDKLSVLLGLRYIYNEEFKNYATPNVALKYELLKGWNVRASYSTGYRTPTLAELYSTNLALNNDRLTLNNLALKPEKSNYFSFNTEYTNRRFSVSGNVYYNKVRDMINYRNVATGQTALSQYGHEEVRMRDNIDKAHVFGVNVNGNIYLGWGFSLQGGFNYTDAVDEATDNPIDKSIKNAWNAGGNWAHRFGKLYDLNIAVNGRINSRRYSQTYGYAPHYNIWNVNTRHTFHFDTLNLIGQIGVENVFDYVDDRPYNNNYATLTPGRSLVVSLRIEGW